MDLVVSTLGKLSADVGGVTIPFAGGGIDTREPSTFLERFGLIDTETVKGRCHLQTRRHLKEIRTGELRISHLDPRCPAKGAKRVNVAFKTDRRTVGVTSSAGSGKGLVGRLYVWRSTPKVATT